MAWQDSFLPEIAKLIADLKDVELNEFAHRTTENFFNLFNRAI